MCAGVQCPLCLIMVTELSSLNDLMLNGPVPMGCVRNGSVRLTTGELNLCEGRILKCSLSCGAYSGFLNVMSTVDSSTALTWSIQVTRPASLDAVCADR